MPDSPQQPSLPLAIVAKLGLKRAALLGLALLVAVLGIVLVLAGQWQSLLRFLQSISIGWRNIELEKLNAQRVALAATAGADEQQANALDAQYAQLVKENAVEQLRIQGLSHDDVVSELKKRGF